MSPLTATIAALGLLAAGYAVGRIRPWDRLDNYLWRKLTFGGTWTRSKPRMAAIACLHALVRPLVTAGILRQMWRDRGQSPKPTHSPAIRITGPRIPNHRVNEEQEATE
ncbi:hypothetical protein [Streptomyces achromogenes]|uniref:hypothetical protein n=1 Tax=Streptomyces achromogenes TaxID=67255 RepID=UPI003A7F835C